MGFKVLRFVEEALFERSRQDEQYFSQKVKGTSLFLPLFIES